MIVRIIIYLIHGTWKVFLFIGRILLTIIAFIPLLLIYLGGGIEVADQILAFIWGMTVEELHRTMSNYD